jgi:ribosomal protein S18 acetylase RimI-like enzyme
MTKPITIDTARPEELAPALRLVFQHLPGKERDARVANALVLICQNELDPRGIRVARAKSGLVGAMVSLCLPGAGGLVWPPQAVAGPARTEVEDELVRSARHWLRQGGAKVGQAILTPQEALLAAPLERNGFCHITSLWYLHHDLEVKAGEDAPAEAGILFQSYPESDPELFQQTLMRTYEGTLDCPELTGVREPAEIMAGHRAQGKHDPELWWLVLRAGVPVGVLLLTEMPEWEALDVAYLGVVPEARGQGLGRLLARKAVREARRADVSRLTLAMDSRNLPARRVYLGVGFQEHEEREVYLALWS